MYPLNAPCSKNENPDKILNVIPYCKTGNLINNVLIVPYEHTTELSFISITKKNIFLFLNSQFINTNDRICYTVIIVLTLG